MHFKTTPSHLHVSNKVTQWNREIYDHIVKI
jgi:hypothetical protein